MANASLGLKDYPTLYRIAQGLDDYLCRTHAEFFGGAAVHPVLRLKRHKVIHDNLWGDQQIYMGRMSVDRLADHAAPQGHPSSRTCL